MIDLDSWQEVAATLSKNKLRTFLTALGVFWGIFMLIVLLAMGDSLRRGIGKQMAGFAPNVVFVWGQRTSVPFKGYKPTRPIQFDTEDIAPLARVPGVEALAPRLRMGGFREANTVSRGDKAGTFGVMGDYPAMRHIWKMDFVEGRFLDPLDLRERRKVAVIGTMVRDELFAPGERAVGQHIKIKGVYFEIVGVSQPRGKGGDLERQGRTIFVPFTTFQQAFNTGSRVNFFAILVDPAVDGGEVERAVREVLRKRHEVAPSDDEAFGSFNAAEEFGKVAMLFVGINAFIWVVGAFTLLAGVLGVSNIMLIAVKERTKELGVRKALGATPGAIVRMVLAESLALTAAAGYLGFLAAVLAVELAGPLLDGKGPLVAPQIDFGVAITATLILAAGGVIAGIIPARHASRIKPVEALRAE